MTLICVALVAQPKPQEEQIIVATDTIYILTDNDLSQLYTYKPEERTINPDIVEIDQDDAVLLMQIGRAEGGPTLDGQLWAMRVILNRVDSTDFDNTIKEVVSEKNQFEVYTKGTYKKVELNENSHLALALIESGWNETQSAVYWRADNGSEGSWHDNNLEYIETVEGNRYYK